MKIFLVRATDGWEEWLMAGFLKKEAAEDAAKAYDQDAKEDETNYTHFVTELEVVE